MRAVNHVRKRSSDSYVYLGIAILAAVVFVTAFALALGKPAGVVGRLDARLHIGEQIPIAQFISLLGNLSNYTSTSYNITYTGTAEVILGVANETFSASLPIKLDAITNGTAFRLMLHVTVPTSVFNGGDASQTENYNFIILNNGTELYVCAESQSNYYVNQSGYSCTRVQQSLGSKVTLQNMQTNPADFLEGIEFAVVKSGSVRLVVTNESETRHANNSCAILATGVDGDGALLTSSFAQLNGGLPPINFVMVNGTLSTCFADYYQNLLPLNGSIVINLLLTPTEYTSNPQHIQSAHIQISASINEKSVGKPWSLASITTLPGPANTP